MSKTRLNLEWATDKDLDALELREGLPALKQTEKQWELDFECKYHGKTPDELLRDARKIRLKVLEDYRQTIEENGESFRWVVNGACNNALFEMEHGDKIKGKKAVEMLINGILRGEKISDENKRKEKIKAIVSRYIYATIYQMTDSFYFWRFEKATHFVSQELGRIMYNLCKLIDYQYNTEAPEIEKQKQAILDARIAWREWHDKLERRWEDESLSSVTPDTPDIPTEKEVREMYPEAAKLLDEEEAARRERERPHLTDEQILSM